MKEGGERLAGMERQRRRDALSGLYQITNTPVRSKFPCCRAGRRTLVVGVRLQAGSFPFEDDGGVRFSQELRNS